MKKAAIVLLVLMFILPIGHLFAQSNNAGFVPGNIWYSIDPFEEGDRIKIYTLIFNPDVRELSGTVSFFDNSTLLGKKDFKVSGKTVKDVSIDWTVSAGSHKIFAKIQNAKFLVTIGKYEEVDLAGDQTDESPRVVNKKITEEPLKAKVSTPTKEEATTLEDIEKNIAEKTPKIISAPIIATVAATENIRILGSNATEIKKVETQAAIKALKSTDNKSPKAKEAGKFITPVKYVELFFFYLLSSFFKFKIIFYGVILATLFYLVRYIFRLIF